MKHPALKAFLIAAAAFALITAVPAQFPMTGSATQAGGGGGGATPPVDAPMVHSPVTTVPDQKPEPSAPMKVLQAISWYIPNRIADIFDVPKLYITLGSGLGGTLRATKYFYFSYYDSEAFAIGWGGRKMESAGSIFFHERIDEKYLGFLAAQEGKLQRDPTELGLSLSLWAIGANIALSGAELLDAATGLVGVDLMGDDHGPVLFDKMEKEKPVPPAPEVVK